jgi:hypothetical protein
MGYRRRGPFGAYRENGSSVFMEKTLWQSRRHRRLPTGGSIRSTNSSD